MTHWLSLVHRDCLTCAFPVAAGARVQQVLFLIQILACPAAEVSIRACHTACRATAALGRTAVTGVGSARATRSTHSQCSETEALDFDDVGDKAGELQGHTITLDSYFSALRLEMPVASNATVDVFFATDSPRVVSHSSTAVRLI
jgi:hypothetical protein